MAKYGLQFEALLRNELDRLMCETHWSLDGDEKDMVDATVWRLDDVVLPIPIEVQVTFQKDHYLKLSRFLRTRGVRPAASIYVEFADNALQPAAAAHAMKRLCVATRALGEVARGMVGGARLVPGGGCETFDIPSRLVQLREVLDPARTADKRIQGLVHCVQGLCLTVNGRDGKVYEGSIGDIIETALYKDLLIEGKTSGNEFSILVSFIPEGRRAKGIVSAGNAKMQL